MCRSQGGLLADEKEEKNALNDNAGFQKHVQEHICV